MGDRILMGCAVINLCSLGEKRAREKEKYAEMGKSGTIKPEWEIGQGALMGTTNHRVELVERGWGEMGHT